MTRQIPHCEPEIFAAGQSAQWRRAFGDYRPADGYALVYYFRGADTFDVTADGAGTDWLVTIAPGDTATKPAGEYRWSAYAEKRDDQNAVLERWPIASGILTLTANLETAGAGALQAWAEQALPIVEAAIKGALTKAQASFQINGVAVTHYSLQELYGLRNRLKAELRSRRRGGRPRPLGVRFTRG